MNRSLMAVTAGLLILFGAGCKDTQAQQQAKETAKFLGDPVKTVSVQPVSTATLTETVDVTGEVTAGEDTTVGAKQSGRIVSVYVKDGDTVSTGQLLATQETTAPQAQLQQAQAQVSQALAAANSARANLAQALRNAAVGPEKSSAGVQQANAQLRSARAQLQKALNGARPEERRQAESNVASAKSSMDTQQRELARVKTLVNEGAIAGNRLDQQQTAYDNARSQYENALQSLNIIRNGTRSEDIETAREQVRQAEEAVRTAQAQKQLDPLLKDQVDAARAQVESTRAQLESAQAQVRIAQQALADTQIRAPFAGKVVGKPVQAGTIAGNQTAVVRIIGGAGVYFSGQLPSTQVTKVRQGMPVTVTIDALPGRNYTGTVAAVSAQAAGVGRLFDVRVSIAGGAEVRPGMFATGRIVVRTLPSATVVPDRAIVRAGDAAYVFVVRNGSAERLPVTTGLQQGTMVQVTGLPLNTSVVVQGQDNLAPGAKVKVESSGAAATRPEKGAAQQG